METKETKKATKRLLDSVWTVEFKEVSPTEVEIVRYSRDDQEGYDRERKLPQGVLVETENRTVTHLLIREEFDSHNWVNETNADRKLLVVNPKHIFDYNA